jgi:hypothetical protein
MMRNVVLVIVVIAALVLSGCIMTSPEIVTPKTQIAQPAIVSAADCFYQVNDSAHSVNTGSSQQITVKGYVSDICNASFEGLTVRGTFSDRDGRTFASADSYVGHVGYHEMAPFSLTIDTNYTDLYTYRLAPVIAGQGRFF